MEERKVLQVTNITHSAAKEDLSDLFSIAGNVTRATIIQSGFPYYGFVEFFNAGDARRAINLSGKYFGPSKITVAYSTQPFPQQPLLSAPTRIPTFNQINQYNEGYQGNDQSIAQDNQYNNPRQEYNNPRQEYNNPRQEYNNPRQEYNNPRQEMQQIVQLNKPSFGSEEVTEVLVSNIPVTLKEHNIHQLFSEFGSVVDVNLMKDASGLATGRGKVAFTSLENASRAASSLNGKQLDGCYTQLGCTVKHNNKSRNFSDREDRQDLQVNLQMQNNPIRHHPYQNPNEQQQQFNNFNNMNNMNQGPPPQQYHQHFDNVPFEREYNFGQPQPTTFNIHGGATHSLTASPTAAPPQQQQPTAVYVGNLPETSCKNCLLYQLFAPYGAITSVKAMENKGEQREGKPVSWFGFVNYTDLPAANLAIMTLDKSTLDGQVLKVVIKVEKPGFGKTQNRGSRFSRA